MPDESAERLGRWARTLTGLGRLPPWKRWLLSAGALLTGGGALLAGETATTMLGSGVGILGGFAVGRVVRAFVRRALTTVAIVVAVVWGLSALGVLPEGWTPEAVGGRVYDAIASLAASVQDAALRLLPPGLSTGAGLFAGARRDD
ncbi:MAG: hypothetical protein AAF628_26225 [Planctomycetota bacterium]